MFSDSDTSCDLSRHNSCSKVYPTRANGPVQTRCVTNKHKKLRWCWQPARRMFVEVNKHGTILGPLRLSLSMWPVPRVTRHNSVPYRYAYRYVTFILAVCCSSNATELCILRRYLTITNMQSNLTITRNIKYKAICLKSRKHARRRRRRQRRRLL